MTTVLTNNKIYITVDSKGAEITSLRDIHGTEYLWCGDEKYWKGQSPVLFPIVGALRNGRTIIDGNQYEMRQHGIARHCEFKLLTKQSDRAHYRLVAGDETKKEYPFDFALDICYELCEESLIVKFIISNKGKVPMPFVIGAHPGFNIPLLKDEKLTDYKIMFEKIENCNSSGVDLSSGLIVTKERVAALNNDNMLNLCHEMFYNDALVLENLKSRSVQMYNPDTGRGVKVDFDGFDYLGIWQAKNAPFVCVEPWTGTATTDCEDDEFTHKRGMKVLEEAQSVELSYKITIL